MLELKTRVEELKMENEYQLRLKDMNYSEKIKELTDKFIQEMESLKTKNQVCLGSVQPQQRAASMLLSSGPAAWSEGIWTDGGRCV